MKIPGYMLLFCCNDCSLLCAAKLCATIEVAGATGVDGSELKWALNTRHGNWRRRAPYNHNIAWTVVSPFFVAHRPA